MDILQERHLGRCFDRYADNAIGDKLMRVFVSYSTKDLADVEALRASLAGSPIEIFVAENSVKPSESLASEIKSAIRVCDLFVVVWSNNAKNSDWVSQEVGQAVALKKPVLPIVLEGSMGLPGFISDLKYISSEGDRKGAIEQACKVIAEQYDKKRSAEAEAQKRKAESDAKFWLGAGALALWLFSK